MIPHETDNTRNFFAHFSSDTPSFATGPALGHSLFGAMGTARSGPSDFGKRGVGYTGKIEIVEIVEIVEYGEVKSGRKDVKAAQERRKERRRLWSTIGCGALLIGIPILLILQEVQRLQRNPALIAAIKRDDVETAVALLEAGADANASDEPSPPLTFREICADLRDRLHGKTPPRPPRDAGYPPALLVLIHYDLYRGGPVNPNNRPMMEALLRHGADPNAEDFYGDTALYKTVLYNNHSCVRLLLEHGADANRLSLQGITPLMVADVESAKLLLAHGAKADRAALNCARQREDGPLLHLLQEAGAEAQAEGDFPSQ